MQTIIRGVHSLWYYFMKAYVGLGLRVFFKSIRVSGKENIPENESVLLTANHQNAFMDALLITISVKGQLNYLVRADIFENPVARGLLGSLNMMPIYRIRDGWKSLAKNEAIFQCCYKMLGNRKKLLIFPEGNHNIKRRIRPLSKGFTRLAEGAYQANPQQPIYVLPVGLNYSNHPLFRAKASVVYGKPILANSYLEGSDVQGLKQAVADALKQLTAHVESLEQYDSIVARLDSNPDIYLNPVEANQKIALIEKGEVVETTALSPKKSQCAVFYALGTICWLPWLPVMLLWRWLENRITDLAFLGSIKFVFGVGLVAPYTLALAYILYSIHLLAVPFSFPIYLVLLVILFVAGGELFRVGEKG